MDGILKFMALSPIQPHPVRPRWTLVLLVIALLVLIAPAWVFWSIRSVSALRLLDLRAFSLSVFPLVGLYAFTFVWFQLMIGSSMDRLRNVFPWIEKYHRTEGVFVLLFALAHPLLLLIGVGSTVYFQRSYIAPQLVPYLWLGYVQLFLICLTAGTALLRKTPFVKKYWRAIHYLNYLVFVSVWIHSWFLGTDVRSTNLRYLWIFFALTALASTLWRIARARRVSAAVRFDTTVSPPSPAPLSSAEPAAGFVKAAAVDQVHEGQPLCADVGGQAVAIFKVGDSFFALDNTCSHAGGPLCEGTQQGNAIECPWHGSKFDVATGALKQGPAVRPQKKYSVRIKNEDIEVRLA